MYRLSVQDMSESIEKFGNLKSEYLLNPESCSSFTSDYTM